MIIKNVAPTLIDLIMDVKYFLTNAESTCTTTFQHTRQAMALHK